MELKPDDKAQVIPLINARFLPASSPIAVNLQVDLDWAALLSGSFTTQTTAVNAFDVEIEFFDGKTFLMAAASPTSSQIQGLSLLGRAEYGGTLKTSVEMSLLQYTKICLVSDNTWNTKAFGQFKDWTSNPTLIAQKYSGFLSSSGRGHVYGLMISRFGSEMQNYRDLQFWQGDAAMIGPVGDINLPIAMTISESITYDETMTSAALPMISVDYFSFELFKKQTLSIAPQDLTFSLGDSVLIPESGQLPLPAGLPLGYSTITVSLTNDPDVRSSLTLTKVKPDSGLLSGRYDSFTR